MRWFWPALTATIVADGLSMRRRVEALDVLEASDEAVDPSHRIVTAAGVTVDDATARAASAHAARHQLAVLDLIPRDLPAERLMALVRLVDPATFRTTPMANGVGASHAVLVTAEVADRARLDRFDGLEPAEMAEVFSLLKRFAPRDTSHALAPGLATPASGPNRSVGDQAAVLNRPLVVGVQLADLALYGGAARSRRPWALAAVAARAAQPMVVAGGTRATPRDLAGVVPRQLVSSALGLRAALAIKAKAPSGQDPEQARREYDELMAPGIDRFFEPRREACPLCGSGDLHVRVRAHDHIQCKPGTFTLERCAACDHVFQNPALTPDGLDFYYRDFYDGAADHLLEGAFALIPSFYKARAELVKGVAEPKRWLDVGGGHGHFSLAAQDVWPDTTFEGLDMSDSIEEAERRRWVAQGHRGMFPDLAPELAGQFDVVSMFHYIEHTRDPLAELDAASTVLGPDGVILIEVPDPESRIARVMGEFWAPWAQPQHLHFLTVDNLTRLLGERGFDVVTVRRAEAHIPIDFVSGATEFVNSLAPRLHVPWRPRPTPAMRVKRAAALVAGAPVVAAGWLADIALLPLGGRMRTSNTYRLLAKRRPIGG